MIEHIDNQLRDWFYWMERQVSGGLGYPKSYEFRIPGGKAGPILPEIIPPKGLRHIHEAISVMPAEMWTVLVWRYGQPGTQADQAKKLNRGVTAYKHSIHNAHCWLSGYMRKTDSKTLLTRAAR